MAKPLGTPRSFNQVSKGVTIIAINRDNKNGTSKDSAARIPAITTTKAAITNIKRDTGDKLAADIINSQNLGFVIR